MTEKKIDYKIDDRLWKSAPPYILEYKVVGIRDYADGKQYELECLSCNHGEKCRILVGGTKKLVFIDVLNDKEEDPQRIWHEGSTQFWPSLRRAQLERFSTNISNAKKNVEKAEQALENHKKHLQDLLNANALLENEIKELEG